MTDYKPSNRVALVGLSMYASLNGLNYVSFRNEMHEMVVQEWGQEYQLETGAIDHIIDLILVDETGQSGFAGYILFRAQGGVSIGKVFGSNQIDLGPFLTWVYWMVEVAIITGIAASQGWKVAGEPYCENCDQWYGGGQHLGGAKDTHAQELIDLLHMEDFSQIGKMLQEDTDIPSLEVYLARCPGCDSSDARLTMESVSINAKGKVVSRKVVQGMITSAQGMALLQAVSERNPD